MFRKKNKVELSPKLKLGVGRAYSQSQLFKYSGVLFLIISAGLVFNAVRLWSNQEASLVSESQLNPQVLEAQDQVQFEEYTVVSGDTLFNIAQRYHIDWATLVTLNNLTPPLKLKVGQVLKVPRP